jgi:hypothetical protein
VQSCTSNRGRIHKARRVVLSDNEVSESGMFAPFRRANRNKLRDEVIVALYRSCEMSMIYQIDLMTNVDDRTKKAVAELHSALAQEFLKGVKDK